MLEEEGLTAGGSVSIPNEQFASEVARRFLKALGGSTSSTPLYHVDTRLRPHGSSGPLVVTLDVFRHYFLESAQSWERLALTRARVVFSAGGFSRAVTEAIREAQCLPVDPASLAHDVVSMRRKLEDSRSRSDLKRGYGGLSDIEFLVHYLQLVHGVETPEVVAPNLWEALDALRRMGYLKVEAHTELRDAYTFWRTVESRLRIVHNGSPADLPENLEELARLARRLNYTEVDAQDAAFSFRTDAAHACEPRLRLVSGNRRQGGE